MYQPSCVRHGWCCINIAMAGMRHGKSGAHAAAWLRKVAISARAIGSVSKSTIRGRVDAPRHIVLARGSLHGKSVGQSSSVVAACWVCACVYAEDPGCNMTVQWTPRRARRCRGHSPPVIAQGGPWAAERGAPDVYNDKRTTV